MPIRSTAGSHRRAYNQGSAMRAATVSPVTTCSNSATVKTPPMSRTPPTAAEMATLIPTASRKFAGPVGCPIRRWTATPGHTPQNQIASAPGVGWPLPSATRLTATAVAMSSATGMSRDGGAASAAASPSGAEAGSTRARASLGRSAEALAMSTPMRPSHVVPVMPPNGSRSSASPPRPMKPRAIVAADSSETRSGLRVSLRRISATTRPGTIRNRSARIESSVSRGAASPGKALVSQAMTTAASATATRAASRRPSDRRAAAGLARLREAFDIVDLDVAAVVDAIHARRGVPLAEHRGRDWRGVIAVKGFALLVVEGHERQARAEPAVDDEEVDVRLVDPRDLVAPDGRRQEQLPRLDAVGAQEHDMRPAVRAGQ